MGIGLLALSAAVGGYFIRGSSVTESTVIPYTSLTTEAAIPTASPSTKPSSAPARKTASLPKVKVLNIPTDQVVYLNGPIGANAQFVIDDLKHKAKAGKPLYMLIDSPGGSVLDGDQILSAMESLSVPVNTVCTLLCASMAQVIHQYGKTRYALSRSILMAHPASGGVQGTLEQMSSRLTVIKGAVYKTDEYIAKRNKMSLEAYHNLVVSEFWIDAEDAIASGKWVDEIVSVNTDAKPSVDLMTQFRLNTNTEDQKSKINVTW